MTKIEWTQKLLSADGAPMPGFTWNPTVGCKEESAGCRFCYAKAMAWRHIHNPKTGKDYEGTVKKLPNGEVVWTGQVNLLEHRLLQPAQRLQPSVYFVDSMSDLFHPNVPFEYIDKVFAVMMLCPQHIFQILTKHTSRMLEYCLSRQDFDQVQEAAEIIVSENAQLFHVCTKLTKAEKDMHAGRMHISNELLNHLSKFGWFWDGEISSQSAVNSQNTEGCQLPTANCRLKYEEKFPSRHIWLGTSIEDQHAANKRGKPLFEIHKLGWLTWVSNEPAIGPVDWEEPFYFGFLDWMVSGGESGNKNVRPLHPEWVRHTRDFCSKNNIPFFFKQWGEWLPFEETAQAPFWRRCDTNEQYDGHELNMIDPETCEAGKFEGHSWYDTMDGIQMSIDEGGPQVTFLQTGKSGNEHLLDGVRHEAYPEMKSVTLINNEQ